MVRCLVKTLTSGCRVGGVQRWKGLGGIKVLRLQFNPSILGLQCAFWMLD